MLLSACKETKGNVLEMPHGGVIHVVYHLVKGMEWSNAKKPVPVENCSVHVLDTVWMEIEEELCYQPKK